MGYSYEIYEIANKKLQEKRNKHLKENEQKRRLIMRVVEEMTLESIADKEHCDISTIKESIDSAIKKIKKYLEKHPQK